MLVQNLLRLFQRGAHCDGDQIVLGHYLADGNIETGFKTEVAIGQDTDELFVFRDGHAGNFIFPHYFQRIINFVVRRHGDGIYNHPAL